MLKQLSLLILLSSAVHAADLSTASSSATAVPTAAVAVSTHPIRSIHVTAWQAGSTKYRHYLDKMFQDTLVNAVTIDIKEYQGEVYIPGVSAAKDVHAYVNAMPDLEAWLTDLKK